MCQRGVRVQVQGSAVCSYRIAMATHAKEHHALSDVRPRIALIEAEGRASVRARALKSRLHIAHKGDATQGDNSQQAVRLPVVGRHRDRALAERLGSRVSSARALADIGQRARHTLPGVEALRRLALTAEVFRGIELRLDRCHDALGNLVLDGKEVGQLAVVPVGPYVSARDRVNELYRDADSGAGSANSPFKDVTCAEVAPCLCDVDDAFLVLDTAVARDDGKPTGLGQCGGDLRGDAVCQGLL